MNAQLFLSEYPSSATKNASFLTDPAFRDSIYQALHPSPENRFLPLLRELFQLEVDYRSDESNDGDYFENIYWVALFLYQFGELDDVIPMWRGKHTNMDTGRGFDIQFLVGAGVETTLDYLQDHADQESTRIAAYLSACKEAGDFDDLEGWLASRIRYFS